MIVSQIHPLTNFTPIVLQIEIETPHEAAALYLAGYSISYDDIRAAMSRLQEAGVTDQHRNDAADKATSLIGAITDTIQGSSQWTDVRDSLPSFAALFP